MQINSMCPLTHINEKMVQMILHEYSILLMLHTVTPSRCCKTP